MNSRDDDLTFENIDERVEQLMRQGEQTSAPAPLAGLSQTVRDLQRVYDEERRLEQAWAKIRSRAQSLESTEVSKQTENRQSFHRQSFQGEQKTMSDTPVQNPGSFQLMPDGPAQRKNSRRRVLLNVGMGLVAAVVLITVFAWLASPVLHGTQAASGGGTPGHSKPTPQPTFSATCPTPTPTVVSGIPPTPQPTIGACMKTPQPSPTPRPGKTPVVTPTPGTSPASPTPTSGTSPVVTPTPGTSPASPTPTPGQ